MIPTAESIAENIDNEFFKENSYYLGNTMPIEFAKRTAIEFAKLHCIEQARVIAEKATVDIVDYEPLSQQAKESELLPVYGVDENSILNAYSLDLIK